MSKQKILIDTDMGNDDIMAISILLLSPLVEIKGISVVNGVADVDQGTANLSRILNYCGQKIPIVKGAKRALMRTKAQFPLKDKTRANELTLLVNLQIPSLIKIRKSNSCLKVEEFIYQIVRQNKITILALGPLTNIAKVIKKYNQEFIRRVARIVMMGGGIKKGNVPPLKLAEYNIWLDPEAANIVFSSGIQITMVGIDATSFVPTTKNFKEKVKKIIANTSEGKIIKEIILNNQSDFDAFYDPLAAFILIDPSIIERKITASIAVSLSKENLGQTILKDEGRKNVTVIMKVNSQIFYRQILNLLEK